MIGMGKMIGMRKMLGMRKMIVMMKKAKTEGNKIVAITPCATANICEIRV